MNLQLFYKIKFTTKLSLVFVFIIAFLFNNHTIKAQKKDFVVVLDAGHGGKDPGKHAFKKYYEKDIALKIVLETGKLLEKEPNIKVVYTRKKDVFVELKDRGKIANRADADLFVSVHCNAHHTQAYGAETYVLGLHVNDENFEVAKAENEVILLEDNYQEKYKGFNPNSPESVIGLTLMQEEYLDQSIQLASIIQEGFTKKMKRRDRGVKQAGFVVLHQTYMPSVLVETGFITNRVEGPFLNSAKGQKNFSNSIYQSIKKYVEQINVNTISIASNEIRENRPAKTNNSEQTQELKDVQFKVQIAAGSRKLATKSYNFNGLTGVERVQFGKSYKYYLGNTSDYSEVQELQKAAKRKGFSSAFIVAFKSGVRIPIEEVLIK